MCVCVSPHSTSDGAQSSTPISLRDIMAEEEERESQQPSVHTPSHPHTGTPHRVTSARRPSHPPQPHPPNTTPKPAQSPSPHGQPTCSSTQQSSPPSLSSQVSPIMGRSSPLSLPASRQSSVELGRVQCGSPLSSSLPLSPPGNPW